MTGSVVFVLMLLAGFAKAWNVEQFYLDLSSWHLFEVVLGGKRVAAVAAVAVPALEIWLALGYLSSRGSSVMMPLGCAVMLIVFSALYGHEMVYSSVPPSCACLGLWDEYYAGLNSGYWVLLRNALMLALLGGSQIIRLQAEELQRR